MVMSAFEPLLSAFERKEILLNFLRTMEICRKKHPKIQTVLSESGTESQIPALMAGLVDICHLGKRFPLDSMAGRC